MNNFITLNEKLLSFDDHPIGLAYGKMGICIYYFYLSRWEEKEEYKQTADKLLDDVISNIQNTKDLSFEHGLTGIAIGLIHLVNEKFVGGDLNEILDDIDSYIFKSVAFLNLTDNYFPKSTLIHLIYYFYLRHNELQSTDSKYLYQELIIKMIEMFQHNLKADFYNEQSSDSIHNYHPPVFLYAISKIYELDIYNPRISKIMEEFFDKILATMPLLHTNRLYLLFGLLSISPYEKFCPTYKEKIASHIRLLRENIDIEHIMIVENKNQDIYIKDGLSFAYILLVTIQKSYPEYAIDFNPQSLYDRIMNSEAWNALTEREYYLYLRKGLYDGYPGVNLVLYHIKRYFL